MRYRWRGYGFDAPESKDESALLLIDPSEPPSWNLNVRLDELPGGAAAFAAYCDAQQPPDGVTVDKKEQRTIAGRPGCLIDQQLRLDDGGVFRQQQLLLLDGKHVLIATMTARTSAHAKAKEAFERFVSTLKIET